MLATSAFPETQLPLRAGSAVNSSPIDPRERLEAPQRDRAVARVRIREALDWLVERHRADVMLPESNLTKAVNAAAGYADDMISDATDRIESEVEREIEEEIDRLEKRGLW